MNVDNKINPIEIELSPAGSGSIFMMLMLRHYFWYLAIIIIAGLGLITIGLVEDIRLTVIGLMIWFLILPLISAWCWIKNVLTEINAINLSYRILRFHNDELEVIMYRRQIDGESEDEDGTELKIDERWDKIHTYHFSITEMKGYEITSSGIFIKIIKSKSKGWLFVPNNQNSALMQNLCVIMRKV